MAQKSSSFICLRLLFVVLIVVALAQSSCIDTIRQILNRPKGGMLMGGWRAVNLKDPQAAGVVKDLVASGVKEYNRQSNDMHHFKLLENGIGEAYSQLVNGVKYCVEFTLVSARCKNNLNGDYCRDGKQVTCAVSAYKAFSDTTATVDRASLSCSAVVA